MSSYTSRSLNEDQVYILKLLYRFRFATVPLLDQHLKPTNRQSLNSRMDILCRGGYVGKKYDKSYKLPGKPASYYLRPKAFPILRELEGVAPTILKNAYGDGYGSAQFIEHCLSIFAISNRLEQLFGGRLDLFTKSELSEGYPHFPQPLPDGFISLKRSDKPRARSKHFFLSVFEEQRPFFRTMRTVNQYLNYDGWDISVAKPPNILLVCNTPSLEKRLQKQGANVESKANEAQKFYTTTLARLTNTTDAEDIVWQPLTRLPEALVSLADA